MDWQMVNDENNINCIVVIKNVVVDVFYEISKKNDNAMFLYCQ